MPRYYSHLKYIAIELTNNCNLKCKVCWSQNPTIYPPRQKGYMTETLFTKIISELKKDAEFHSVSLHFAGESTLHPRFKEFSYLAHDAGFGELTLATNGVLMDQPTRKTLIDCYDALAISLHNTPNLKQAITNLKALMIEAGPKAKDIRANVVVDEFSPSELYQIKYALFGIVHVKEMRAIAEDMQAPVVRTRFYPLCPNKYYYAAILWNGDVLPCCHMLSSGDWSLGNVSEKSIHDVFYGYKFRRLRHGYEKGTPCESCTVRS